MNKQEIINELNNDNVVCVLTDTVPGFIVKMKKGNIQKINNLKNRNEDQPLQILFSNVGDAIKYSTKDYFTIEYLKNNYENFTSYIIDAEEDFSRKTLLGSFERTFLFRVVTNEELKEIINEVGPVFASSANKHDEEIIFDQNEIETKFNIPVLDFGKATKKENSKIISLLNQEVKEIR